MTYSTRKAAEQLGVNINTLLRWINLGKVKARKAVFGNGWIFTEEDIRAIRKWREAPLAILDLAKVEQAPVRVNLESARLRPDLDLFGQPFRGSYPYGSEHPYQLLSPVDENGHRFVVNGTTVMNEAMRTPPWSILDSQEYLDALAAKRAQDAATPARSLHPAQEQANALYEKLQKEQDAS